MNKRLIIHHILFRVLIGLALGCIKWMVVERQADLMKLV